MRTAAEGASEEELRADVERLTKAWDKIKAKAESAGAKKAGSGGAPALLHGEPDLTVRVIRDVFTEDFTSLVVSGDKAWSEVSQYVEDVAPDLAPRLQRWTAEEDVFAAHRIDESLAKAMDRKVWLPSGGSLVIDRTEAMTVVDVNTGKFVGSGGNLEETVTKNNLEAAEEIVRQLRLRDIGGIIVIDFIDMVLESNRDLVVRRLLECLGRDRTKHQVAEVTSLGLVQMTRKRVGSGPGRGLLRAVRALRRARHHRARRADRPQRRRSATRAARRRPGRRPLRAVAAVARPPARRRPARLGGSGGRRRRGRGSRASRPARRRPRSRPRRTPPRCASAEAGERDHDAATSPTPGDARAVAATSPAARTPSSRSPDRAGRAVEPEPPSPADEPRPAPSRDGVEPSRVEPRSAPSRADGRAGRRRGAGAPSRAGPSSPQPEPVGGAEPAAEPEPRRRASRPPQARPRRRPGGTAARDGSRGAAGRCDPAWTAPEPRSPA